jgi:GTP-binding protein
MKIKTAEIVVSAVAPSQYPNEMMPEIALVGRSNVGKSSAINTILGRKKLARVSASPGKTRTINFYTINDTFYLVDLPGYGYAKASKTERASWGKIIETYLSSRQELQEVVLLVDIRHSPSADDRMMYNWIKHFGYGSIVLATKWDKLSKNQAAKQMKVIREELKMSIGDKLIPFSSLKKEGIEVFWDAVEPLLQIEKTAIENKEETSKL